jgi:serine/threonine protein kinase/tetratricopeptide (TPR) repeat protein
MIQKLGKYKIVDKLGEGAMGSVYKAYDNILDRNVAIKIMADDIKWNSALKLRFYREARAAASLHHPSIVTIFDLGEEGNTTFIVMEYLQGKNLKEIIQEKIPLPLEKKLSIMAQVSEGLNHAHAGGFIHRDIKPGNIFVTSSGLAKILDFGIARIPASNLTRVGDRLGTPIYMSPEQIKGEQYDARSDLFSCGIVFYEFLTYVHPFRDAKFDKTLNNILYQEDFLFAEQFPEAPAGLLPILKNCLAKEPDKRYADMSEVARACHRLLDDMDLASQKMIKGITASLPSLRSESQNPHATVKLKQLAEEAQDLLDREQKPDYVALFRLTSAISAEPLLQADAGFQPTRVQLKEERPVQVISTPPETFPVGTPIPKEPEPAVASSISPADQLPREMESQPSAAEKQIEDEKRKQQMLADVEAILAEGRLDEALGRMRTMMGQLGPIDPLVRMLAETRRKIEERNRAQVAQFLDKAKEAIEAKQYQDAVDALDKVLEAEPGKADAIEQRRKALAEIEAEKTRQARKEEGERGKNAGFKLLAEKKYRDSLRSFKQAAELLGEDQSIKLGIEEAEEGLQVEELHAKTMYELTQAQKLFQSEDYGGARTHVNRALELSPRNQEARDLLAQIGQAQEEKSRRDAIASLLSQSREALNRKDFGEALAIANEALQRDPSNVQAQKMLDSISQAKEETRRREEIAELLHRAEEAVSRQDYSEAESQVHSALVVIPEFPDALECLKKINRARDDQRKKQEISAAVAEAEQAFQREDWPQCELHARRAMMIDAGESRAKELLNRAIQARESKKKEQIVAQLKQGYDALAAGDIQRAVSFAREVLKLEANSPAAEKLIANINQTEADRVKAKIESLMSLSRKALSRSDYESAANLAREVLATDAKNKEAKSLIKEIDKAKRANEKELKRKHKELDQTGAASYAAEAKYEPEDADKTYILKAEKRGGGNRFLVLAGIGIVVVAILVFGIYRITHRRTENAKPIDISTQISNAKSYLDQKKYDEAIDIAQKVLAISPDNSQAKEIRDEAMKMEKQSTIEVLMLEAQTLRGQGQLEESLKIIQKVLDINPVYAPAIEVRTQIQADMASGAKPAQTDEEIPKWLAKADSLLTACKLTEAKAEVDMIKSDQDREIQKRLSSARSLLDACKLNEVKTIIGKVRKVNPNTPELVSLEQQFAAKTAQVSVINGDLNKWSKAAGTQNEIAELTRKAETLFGQAKYDDCRDSLTRLIDLAPQNRRAQELRDLVSKARDSVQSYEDAMAAKRYDAALKVVDRLEEINPADPNIAGYRQQAETRKKSANAILTVYRIGEPATLTLDDKPFGIEGEVENNAISTGSHRLVLKNNKGKQKIMSLDLLDGQNTTYVYDAATLEFRPMNESDRDMIEARKQHEKVNRFSVQHTHGLLRGSCSGELLISGVRVEYKPSPANDHAFTHAFLTLKLKVDGEKIELTEIPGNKDFGTFKARNADTAKRIKELWINFEKSSR